MKQQSPFVPSRRRPASFRLALAAVLVTVPGLLVLLGYNSELITYRQFYSFQFEILIFVWALPAVVSFVLSILTGVAAYRERKMYGRTGIRHMRSSRAGLQWFAVAGGLVLLSAAFNNGSGEAPYSLKDEMVLQIRSIGEAANQYRSRPVAEGGGGGSFIGVRVPAPLENSEQALYRVHALHPDTLLAIGRSKADPQDAVIAKIGPDGAVIYGSWIYEGILR